MKRIFSIFCVCALLLSLSGCGLLDYLYHKEVPINKMEKPVAEVQTDATVQEVEVTEPTGPDLPYPLEFYFSSGAGGWGTSLTLQADGSFTGSFHDSEMGDASADYPNGTVYICNFEGKFSTPVQVDEYTYSMELISFTQEGAEGDTYISEQIRYIVATPYGLEDASGNGVATDFLLYLPNTSNGVLSEDALMFWPGRFDSPMPETLGSYCLLNLNADTPFFS